MCLRAGDVRQPAVLLGTPGLDGHLQERRLRSVVDTAPVLLVELPPSLRPAHPRRRHQGTDRPPTRRITKVHAQRDHLCTGMHQSYDLDPRAPPSPGYMQRQTAFALASPAALRIRNGEMGGGGALLGFALLIRVF